MIAISIYMPQMLATYFAGGASACVMVSAGQMAAASMITGAVVGYAQTGTAQGAIIGAWTGGAFNAAGTAFNGGISNTLAHGMIGVALVVLLMAAHLRMALFQRVFLLPLRIKV